MPVEQAHVHVILNSNQAFHFSIISDPGGEVALIQKGRGCSSYLLRVKKQFWYLKGCSASKSVSTARAFAVTFEPKKRWQEIMRCFRIGTSQERKRFHASPTQQDLGTSQGLLSKFPTSTAVLLYESTPSGLDYTPSFPMNNIQLFCCFWLTFLAKKKTPARSCIVELIIYHSRLQLQKQKQVRRKQAGCAGLWRGFKLRGNQGIVQVSYLFGRP